MGHAERVCTSFIVSEWINLVADIHWRSASPVLEQLHEQLNKLAEEKIELETKLKERLSRCIRNSSL